MNADYKLTPEQVEEWEAVMFEKVDKTGEEFLCAYFDDRMCLRCFTYSVFAVLRSRRQIGTLAEMVTRRWCCKCGFFHKPETIPLGSIRYRAKRKKNW